MKFYCCFLVVVAMAVVVNMTTMTVDQPAWEKIDVNSTAVVNVARQATHDLKAPSAFKLNQILKAKRQIFPGGGIYKLSLELGLTVCQTQEKATLDTCLVVMFMNCKLIALVENSTEVLSYRCKLLHLSGGYEPMDVRNNRIENAAMFAVNNFFKGRHDVQIRNILSAYVQLQVVAGLNYAIRVEIYRVQLGAKTPPEVTQCTTRVFDQPWGTPRRTVTYFKCDNKQF